MLKFKTEKLNDHVTRIFGFTSELMYLVEGNEKAALLDSGSGIGSLKSCVDKLTKKPIIVILTHGHVDHAMGAAEFDSNNVYMNHEDDYVYKDHGKMEKRLASIELSELKNEITVKDFLPTIPCENFHDLKAGDIFDLGGISIETYACSGHTRGSLCFLLREDRTILLGDACNYFTFMFEWYSTTISEYEESLRKLDASLKNKYDNVLLSHGDGNGHKDLIKGVIQVCEDIKNGNVDNIPFEFQGATGFMAKAIDPITVQRIDGGIGNIIYNKNKI